MWLLLDTRVSPTTRRFSSPRHKKNSRGGGWQRCSSGSTTDAQAPSAQTHNKRTTQSTRRDAHKGETVDTRRVRVTERREQEEGGAETSKQKRKRLMLFVCPLRRKRWRREEERGGGAVHRWSSVCSIPSSSPAREEKRGFVLFFCLLRCLSFVFFLSGFVVCILVRSLLGSAAYGAVCGWGKMARNFAGIPCMSEGTHRRRFFLSRGARTLAAVSRPASLATHRQ